MDDQSPSKTSPSRRRSRSRSNKLRKHLPIDNVKVEEPFALNHPKNGSSTADRAGDGCYVSATVNNRRYYGVLIDQEALKAASLLHFQGAASGLELNRRMKSLLEQNGGFDRKRPAEDLQDEGRKRQRTVTPLAAPSSVLSASVPSAFPNNNRVSRQIQKFRFHGSEKGAPGFRELLATYSCLSAAAEDDAEREPQIEAACQNGGNFVGNYYYQFEATGTSLEVSSESLQPDPSEMRMSMGFQSFLHGTMLPAWFPLANLQLRQQKVLSLLNMKKDNKGNVVWDDTASERDSVHLQGSSLPMEPRSGYKVCVVGGGIAGLSAAVEIFRLCERENIDVEVVLMEGRSRLGGRLWTDRDTFKTNEGSKPFPVDLGASWIHGIDLNPLAALAREAGVDFVRTGEDVKMFKAGMKEVDATKDKNAGELFDKLLDIAAESSWRSEGPEADDRDRPQRAIRWYSSVLSNRKLKGNRPRAADVAGHRRSEDVSVDRAVGMAIASQRMREFEHLSNEERRMLFWNLKNVEYALGANMSDLSMKFWDIDERHAFEGDHVLLRQGYSTVVEHLVKQLQQRGSRFQCHLNSPVSSLEYARKSGSKAYNNGSRGKQFLELSDTCRVKSDARSNSVSCDFVVCAVPLGVLKDAIAEKTHRVEESLERRLEFTPSLPFLKKDAIKSVGFGLLDKVYLQFPTPFWREGPQGLSEHQTLFGNASGVNPHHYMFFDVGRTLHNGADAPAVLMSLVSGREAVDCESISSEGLVLQTVDTLRAIFSEIGVPDPIAAKTTSWGSDEFSRGSYTFLPPGATDQDFHALQSPINGNGDSILLEGSETMRVFFCGEHTTALHPSMAHGAMLSGLRAAKEVVGAIGLDFGLDESFDRMIPMSVFRHMNPKVDIKCAFCHLAGGRAYEGPLLAFKRGSRQVLVHNCCAENSPEVEVSDGQWKNVLKAVNRSVSIECAHCRDTGASIGCNNESCYNCYHFQCAEQNGWGFQEYGKEFFCHLHRGHLDLPPFERSPIGGDDHNGNIQHTLFSSAAESDDSGAPKQDSSLEGTAGDGSDPDGYSMIGPLTTPQPSEGFYESKLVRLTRPSVQDCWNVEFVAKPIQGRDKFVLSVAVADIDDPFVELVEGDIVRAINGTPIGSGLDSVEAVVGFLGHEVDILVDVLMKDRTSS